MNSKIHLFPDLWQQHHSFLYFMKMPLVCNDSTCNETCHASYSSCKSKPNFHNNGPALAKRIQWELPGIYGEEKYGVTMGGLYIEMAVLKVPGDWLINSGWTTALVEAEIATPGRASRLFG